MYMYMCIHACTCRCKDMGGGEGGGGRVSYLSTSGEFVQPEGQSDDQLYDKRKETCD